MLLLSEGRIVELARIKTRIQRTAVPVLVLLSSAVQVAAQELPVLGQGNLSCNSWAERRAGDAVDAATMKRTATGKTRLRDVAANRRQLPLGQARGTAKAERAAARTSALHRNTYTAG
jgi:hypothetical protein